MVPRREFLKNKNIGNIFNKEEVSRIVKKDFGEEYWNEDLYEDYFKILILSEDL